MNSIEIPDLTNINAEQCLLSCMLIDNKGIYDIQDKLKPEHFSSTQHKEIYTKILELHGEGKGVDFATLVRSDISSEYIMQLAGIMTTASFIQDYADVVIESHIKREYVKHCQELISSASSLTATDLAISAETSLLDIGKLCDTNETTHVSSVMMSLQDKIITNMEKPEDEKLSLGILSGLGGLDRLTFGFKSGKVYILAGRPSMGKTACITSMVNYITIDQGIPTAIYSLESDKEELMYRNLSTDSKVPCQSIELGLLNSVEAKCVFKSIKRISESPLYINDGSSLTSSKLKSNLKRLIVEKGIKIAFIDYLQLMDGDGKDDYHKVTKLSNDLRKIAKDLNIPIVLLCQLSRAVEGRANGEPTNADLRGSGSIEQDAYCIIFIDRPEMRDPDDPSLKGVAYFKVTKNRGGKIGKSELRFHGETYTFEDI